MSFLKRLVTEHDFSNYIVLKNMSSYLLECYGEEVIDDPRVVFFLTSSMTFSFFAIESLTNIVYIQVVKDSLTQLEDKKFDTKIDEINEQLNISDDEFSKLKERINEMKKFRNNLVHCKPLKVEHPPYEIENYDPNNLYYVKTLIHNKKNVFNQVNKDNTQKYIETVNSLEEMWDKYCQEKFNQEINYTRKMQIDDKLK